MFITPVDPALAPTTTGNLRLLVASPAIDKGDNAYIAGVTKDLEGKPRTVDGDFDGTPTVDMGVYEFQVYNIYLPIIMR